MAEGNRYVVYIYEDQKTSRIAGSAKIENFLDKTPPKYEIGEEVDLLVCQRTDLGYKAIINNKHTGILYENQVFQELNIGQKIKGYIQNLREDDKIDLILHKMGYEKVGDISDIILEKIKISGGFLQVTDKSHAETIYELFGCSKKSYKKAIGDLYRKRLVILEETGIRLA
jgi:predicted RNA-binding protein (virulence factor B family)